MKWKAKFVANDPENGTTRIRRKFAWRPTQIEGDVIWLAHFDILEAFIIVVYRVKIDGQAKELTAGLWVQMEKRMLK